MSAHDDPRDDRAQVDRYVVRHFGVKLPTRADDAPTLGRPDPEAEADPQAVEDAQFGAYMRRHFPQTDTGGQTT